MGKGKQRPQRHGRRAHFEQQQEDDPLPSSAFDFSVSSPAHAFQPATVEELSHYQWEGPSKYELYQLSVQSPKGDISYLQKFFLTYIGGRSPLHLREDFCGTALICAEWLKGGIQRLATGLDLDLEALEWGFQNNFKKLGGDSCSRVRLLHGNVLRPVSLAQLVSPSAYTPVSSHARGENVAHATCVSDVEGDDATHAACTDDDTDDKLSRAPSDTSSKKNKLVEKNQNYERGSGFEEGGAEMDGGSNPWPRVDIVCAFNYSCCCLHKRSDLVSYFKHVQDALADKGGIFAMDLYGGVSSEAPLKLRRHFPNFTYVWEQEEFDVINRMTTISLHFQLKNNRLLRHAFTYHWRLWSLPEVRDCLEEAGFDSIHFWVRDMPVLEEKEDNEDIWDNDSKYEETAAFHQQSAWNAYIVAVALQKSCH